MIKKMIKNVLNKEEVLLYSDLKDKFRVLNVNNLKIEKAEIDSIAGKNNLIDFISLDNETALSTSYDVNYL